MYSILQHSHSGIRYISILLLIILFVRSIQGLGSKTYASKDKAIATMTTISLHIQLVIGFILYFISPKVLFEPATLNSDLLRFFTMEHVLMMLIGIGFITAASVKAKRHNNSKSYKTLLIYGGIGFIILLAGIPWPFREALGVGWI